MISDEAVRIKICKLLAAPDFLRVVDHVFVVTFWDREGGKGLTLEIRKTLGKKWAAYVRAQDRVDQFGLSSYATMIQRAHVFLRRLQGVLQRDYWYGQNDEYKVWASTVHYKGSIYRAAIAASTPKEAGGIVGMRRSQFRDYWKEVVSEPVVIEAALKSPKKVVIEGDSSRWFEAETIPVAIPR
jgi:hypothetical protein